MVTDRASPQAKHIECRAAAHVVSPAGAMTRQRRFETDDFMDHQHIEPPLLEPVDPSTLTPKMRLYYEALAAYVKECEAKKT